MQEHQEKVGGQGHENSLDFPSNKTGSPKVFEAGRDVTFSDL